MPGAPLPSADDLISLRRKLHRNPEVAGAEARTSARVRAYLEQQEPDRLLDALGGHGLAAEYRGADPGPRLLVRCELDALPMSEAGDLPHASQNPGAAHKCGHDGHMAMVAGLAAALRARRPPRGSVVLLFQPAEETGEGAARVLADEKFARLLPDMALALHNLPGFPMGQVLLREGPYASASRGFVARLSGRTAHAAEPHLARSPALALAQLVAGLSALPQQHTSLTEAAQATVIHARLGQVAFGTTPGDAVVMATLRAHHQEVLELLASEAGRLARGLALAHGLELEVSHTEDFLTTENHPEAVDLVRRSARDAGLGIHVPAEPFPWSEDFGRFTAVVPGALVGIGAGRDTAPLHAPGYDFPDELVEPGLRLLDAAVRRYLGEEADR